MANRNTAATRGFIFGTLAIDDMGFPSLGMTASCYVQMCQILRSGVASGTIDFMQNVGRGLEAGAEATCDLANSGWNNCGGTLR